MNRSRTAPAVLAVLACAAGCTSSGTTGPGAVPAAAAGPVQDIRLSGALNAHWTSSANPLGPLAPPPPGGEVTGCYSWADPATGSPVWAARISGTADGHTFRLDLEVDGENNPPTGTHTVVGGGGRIPDGIITLTADGTEYGQIRVEPTDTMPGYFSLDNDGSTGRISVRLTTVQNSPSTLDVEGRWHCD